MSSYRTIAGVVFMSVALGCSGHPGFDSARWEEGRGKLSEPNPRADMVDSAVAAGVHVGGRREDIRRLLGRPDNEDALTDIYFLGRQRWMPELHVLEIEYDEAGVATRVEVVQ